MKQIFLTFFALLLLVSQARAQAVHPWYQAKEAFIREKLQEPFPEELADALLQLQTHHDEEADVDQLESALLKNYWGRVYDKLNARTRPGFMTPVQARNDAGNICENGSFEHDFATYLGETGLFGGGSNQCNYSINWSAQPVPSINHFEIVGTGVDPISNLQQVIHGSQAARINSYIDTCWTGFQADKLTKTFIVTKENAQFTVWFAIALENPEQHVNRQPFFHLNLLNQSGQTVMEKCFSAADAFTHEEDSPCSQFPVVVRDWDCCSFDLRDSIGSCFTLEMIASDCGQGAHFGYAFVDAICEPCIGAVSGSISLGTIPDCTNFPVTYCGTYQLPKGNNWSVGGITIEITNQAGGFTTIIPPSDVHVNPDGTFCFDIEASDLLNDPNACYDVQASVNFVHPTFPPITHISYPVIPGIDNDFCYSDIVCDSSCLTVAITNISCQNQGSADPSDDTWTFDITVTDNSGNGLYWTAGPPANENGAYGITKTVYMGQIAAAGSNPIQFLVYDAGHPECNTVVTVPVPAPCSEPCNLHIETTTGPCNDNGTPYLVSDDTYTVDVSVSGTNGQCFMVKVVPVNGPMVIYGPYTGGDQVVPVTLNIQEGDASIWVFLCDMMTCNADAYVLAPRACSGCHEVSVTNIQCFDNGSSDPSDDYWTFDLFVNGGPGTFWTASSPVSQSGPYGQVKTIHMGQIGQYGSTIQFSIFDNIDGKCRTDLEVNVPEPCSIPCDLRIEAKTGPCNDNGTPVLVSDDTYTVDVTVSGTNGECFMLKRVYADGTMIIDGPYSGDQVIQLTLNVQDGDVSLWVFLCNLMTCSADAYILAPEFCSGCHDVAVSNIQCFNNGTSDPSDDYWTFDLLVSGGPGWYWTSSAPVSQSGPYGQVKTIYMGQINQYGSDIQFSVFDVPNKKCQTDLIVPVPKTCSAECELRTEIRVGDCVSGREGTSYYVSLNVSGTGGACWMAKQKLADGTEIVLGTFYGDQAVNLGPFDPALGDWTLWVFLCESMDCVRDHFVDAPDCNRKGEKAGAARRQAITLSNDYLLYPSPAQDVLWARALVLNQAPTKALAEFTVVDMLGKTVSRLQLPADTDAYRLDISALPSGVYFLVVDVPQQAQWRGKFVKK